MTTELITILATTAGSFIALTIGAYYFSRYILSAYFHAVKVSQ